MQRGWIAAIAAGCLAGVLAGANSPAVAQDPATNNPFDGQWTLDFSVSTPPGGSSIPGTLAVYKITILQLQAKKEFEVGEDGALTWQNPDSASYSMQHANMNREGTTVDLTSRQGGLLRATGQVVAESRALELKLQYAPARGRSHGRDSFGNWWTQVWTVSADGSNETSVFRSNRGSNETSTRAIVFGQSDWTLEPSIEIEGAGTDLEREVATYRGNRNAQWGPLAITETVEVRQVRYGEIVLRGEP
jgi:hypothetical protein